MNKRINDIIINNHQPPFCLVTAKIVSRLLANDSIVLSRLKIGFPFITKLKEEAG